MTTIGGTALTLLDYTKRLNPQGGIETDIAELLSQQNAILEDMLWKEGNLPTGERVVVRTGLPASTWRKLNQGVQPTKSTTAQIDEACAMLEQRGQIDKALAALNGNTAAFRLSENQPHMEAMTQDLTENIIYGSSISPEKFIGVSERFSTISGAVNGQNIISGGGVGNDNTSIWLFGWGPNSIYGIFPKGTKGGLQHQEIKDGSADGCFDAIDSNGGRFRALGDHYTWNCGIALKDWRYVVRIPNIDVSNLIAESSAADVCKLMSRALDRLPSEDGIKPVFYMNRTVFSMLKIQALAKSSAALSIQDALNQFGKSRKELSFLGVPVRKVDKIVNTESAIS